MRRLLYLLGLAVIGVVAYHATGWGFIAMFWWTDRYLPVSVPNFDQLGNASYFALRAIEQLVAFGIAAFLFVSGFFLMFATGQQHSTIGWKVVLARIKNLVIPYLLWSGLILGLDAVQGRALPASEWLYLLAVGGATQAFYFVPLLVQLYLVAPVLIPLARQRWKLLLVVAGVLQVLLTGLNIAQNLDLDIPAVQSFYFLTRSWLFTNQLFWFVAGLVYGFHHQQLKPWLIRWRWLALASLGLVFLAGILEWEALLGASGQEWLGSIPTLLDQVYALLFLAVFIGFEQVPLPGSKTMNLIGSRSYGIYLAHSLVLIYLSKLIYHFAPQVLGMQWLFQPVLIVAGLGLPWLGMEIVTRTPLRRFYAYIFG